MAGLSNIFGGDNAGSSADSDFGTDNDADLGNTVGIDANANQELESMDEDGNSRSSSNENSLSLDTGTDSLLGNVTDAVGSTNQSTSDE